MSTADQPGPFDGLERALPGEPVFTLRAHDDLAVDLVRLWVERRRAIVVADPTLSDEKRRADLVQCREAEIIAENMIDWRAGEHAKPPEPVQQKPSYHGNTLDDYELAAKARFDAAKEAVERIDNCVAEVVEAWESPHLISSVPRVALEIGLNILREVADAVRPKRRSYAHRGEAGGND